MVFVEEFLGSIGVEEQAISRIMALLDESATALDGAKPGELSPAAFGGSEKGAALGADTSLAHQHVVAAINELVAGMKGYRINVDKWRGDMAFTDEDAGDSFARLQGSAAGTQLLAAIQSTSACTTAPDFTDAGGPACDVEGVSTTGGQG